jgi:hypothetical protein
MQILCLHYSLIFGLILNEFFTALLAATLVPHFTIWKRYHLPMTIAFFIFECQFTSVDIAIGKEHLLYANPKPHWC